MLGVSKFSLNTSFRMLNKIFLCTLGVLISSQIGDSSFYYKDSVPIGKRFIAEGLVPTTIEHPPDYMLLVSFPYNVKVKPGAILSNLEIMETPKPRWKVKDDDTYYTICMCSVDLPREDAKDIKYAEWYPWIVRNIPGGRVKKGETLLPWNIPRKSRRPGDLLFHVFLVYQQQGFISVNDTYVTDQKMIQNGEFRLKEFSKIYNFTAPEGGNYFLLSYPE